MFTFEWYEEKRLSNIKKHSLDFLDAGILFSGPRIEGNAKTVDGEDRRATTGMIEDVYVTAIFTMRGDTVRMISLRRARHGEKKRYQELHGC
jgi:uncharacterized DUF497 family protein